MLLQYGHSLLYVKRARFQFNSDRRSTKFATKVFFLLCFSTSIVMYVYVCVCVEQDFAYCFLLK